MPNPEALLLDTHIWIWLMSGDHALSRFERDAIEEAARRGRVLVSAISVWELGTLVRKQRIRLSQPLEKWVKDAFSLSGLRCLPLTPEIAVESCALPEWEHGDPADRMIVASARLEKARLLTHDEAILSYGAKGYVLTHKD